MENQEVNVELELQKAQLKVQALNEAVTRSGVKAAEAASQYEDTIADLRVELTLVSNERDFLVSQLDGQKDANVPQEDSKGSAVRED